MQGIASAIKVLDKLNNAAFVLEITPLTISLIMKFDVNAAIEERKFLKTLVKRIKVIFCDTENLTVSLEGRFGLPVEMADERLSSFEAKQMLREQGHTGDYKTAPADSVAAELILQTWMNR